MTDPILVKSKGMEKWHIWSNCDSKLSINTTMFSTGSEYLIYLAQNINTCGVKTGMNEGMSRLIYIEFSTCNKCIFNVEV